MGLAQENQPAPVISQPLCLNRPVPKTLPASGSVFDADGEVPNSGFNLDLFFFGGCTGNVHLSKTGRPYLECHLCHQQINHINLAY